MERSVSVELPDMPAGEYSIYMSIAAERDNNLPSVEDVVKRECRKRVENDKLAQIGAAYDLAHSKGTAHLEELSRLRKIKEQQRASQSRKNERRKLWERRHLNREVTKRQTKKNNEKRDRRIAKAEEAAKKAEEAARKKAEEEAIKAAEEAKKKAEEEAKKKAEEEAKKKEEEAKKEAEKPKDQGVQTEAAEEESKEDESIQTEAASSENTEKTTEEASDVTPVPAASDKTSSEESAKAESMGESKDEPKIKSQDESKAESEESMESEGESKVETKDESKDETKDEAKDESKGEAEEESSDEESAETEKAADQPPPPPPPQAARAYDSDGDSSDSPVEDWEELYSSDDMVRKPRLTPAGPAKTHDERYESEEEGLPDPWNAVCIVGIRVYSMDEDLELRVVMEDGELLESGMGKKGEADLDNAQSNAGGKREKQESGDKAEEPGNEPATKAEDEAVAKDMCVEKKDGVEEEEEGDRAAKDATEETTKESNEDSKSEKSADSTEYDKLDSGATTPEVIATPEPTPLDSSKELC